MKRLQRQEDEFRDILLADIDEEQEFIREAHDAVERRGAIVVEESEAVKIEEPVFPDRPSRDAKLRKGRSAA